MSVELDIDQMGVIEGTDKSSSESFAWDYLRHYGEWFSQWRNENINLLEIGVAAGSSLHVWKNYFSKAQIVGIDIDPQCRHFADDRIAIEIGSQDDPQFLRAVVTKYTPTIIIDDGSHQARHIVTAFETLFPSLLPGGSYVVEDLALHFGAEAKRWGSDDGYNPPKYFLELARSCVTQKNGNAPWDGPRQIADTTDSVSFINSAVHIRKKDSADRPVNLQLAKQYIRERSLGTLGLVRYAKYMAANHHDAEALFGELLNDTRSDQADNIHFFMTMAEIQRSRGQMQEAIQTLSRGAERFADSPEMLWRYGHWLAEAGRTADGLKILCRAASLCAEPTQAESIVGMIVDIAQSANETSLAVKALRHASSASADERCRSVLLKGADTLAASGSPLSKMLSFLATRMRNGASSSS